MRESAVLVVLYSINVFLTFSLSLLGLCIYWWRHRGERRWIVRFGLSLLGLSVTATVLVITLVEKFTAGGRLTVLVTGLVVALCVLVKRHYTTTRAELARADELFAGNPPLVDSSSIRPIDPAQPTAIVLVGKHRGVSMHALLWVERLFPGHFKNMIFLAVGEVDAQSYEGQECTAYSRPSAIHCAITWPVASAMVSRPTPARRSARTRCASS